MKSFRHSFDIFRLLKYLFLFLCFLVFNSVENIVLPYGSAIFISALVQGASIIFTPILFILSFILLGDVGLIAQGTILSAVFVIILLIYRKSGRKPKYEISLYTLLGISGFIFLGNTSSFISLEKRIITSVLIVILTFISLVTAKAINEKGLKFKLAFEEFACLSVMTAIFGLGFSNLFSPYIWRGISIVILLTVCYIYKTGIGMIVSSVLSLSLAFYYNNINYISAFLLLTLAMESVMKLSRYTSALFVIAVDYLTQLIFKVYPAYMLVDFLSVAIASAVFCLIPTKALLTLKEKLYVFREKQLVRKTINQNRTALSGKLYDLSGVFTEMAGAFNVFKNSEENENVAKSSIQKEIFSSVCRNCKCFNHCIKDENLIMTNLSKLIDIGFAKGKLSLIDYPRELAEICLHPNDILYGLNKFLATYRQRLIENINIENGRDLIAKEALGVSEILRGLALETGCLLKYNNRMERTLSDKLSKKGFLVNELLIYGEDTGISVSMVIAMNEFSVAEIESILSKTLLLNMELYEQNKITEDKCYLSFRKAMNYDAVYGISHSRKDGSDMSGDTHSVARISYNKFLFALSDGMGSGDHAQKTSSASLSLIESFYKAGLKSELILNTVNKLMSINTEDNFTALDVSVVDLNTCNADFIKYGSPYGFIIGKNGIKIIEGNSLPLGIIDELKPSVASTKLANGDMIVLVTDGISDSFGTASEIIDFLRTVPAKNPQTLADQLLDKAISINDGRKIDDMTVLAVRIFQKNSA